MDALGKANGRGAYLCRSVECFQKAVKTVDWNGRLSRQYRRKYMREWKRRWESLSKRDKVLSLIGLAMKAGKCVSGETMTESETKSGKAKFVIVAGDASENTKKNSGICVSFIKFHFVSTEIKIP